MWDRSSLIAKSASRLICGKADSGSGARRVKRLDLELEFPLSSPQLLLGLSGSSCVFTTELLPPTRGCFA